MNKLERDFRDWQQLADSIARGDTANALDILGRLSPYGVSFATVKLALIRNPNLISGGAA